VCVCNIHSGGRDVTEMRSDPIDREAWEGRQAMPEKWRQLLVVVTSCLCSVPAPRHNWYGIVLYGMEYRRKSNSSSSRM